MDPMLQRSVKSEMLIQAGPLTDPSQSKPPYLHSLQHINDVIQAAAGYGELDGSLVEQDEAGAVG